MKVEKKSFYSVKSNGMAKASVMDVDTTGRIVTGFFNTYNFLDSDLDVLLPGSAKKSIRERGPKSKAVAKIKHALDHDLSRLPGKIVTLEEKTMDGIEGIYFETRMADTTLGNDTLKNYLEGVIDNHSIGFQYMQIEMIERGAKGWDKLMDVLVNPEDADGKGVMFAVKEIALFEGSSVAFGSNQLTPFLGIKGTNKESLKIAFIDRLSKLERALKSGTQSDDMMNVFELQVLQLKQMIEEITDGLDFKTDPNPKPEKPTEETEVTTPKKGGPTISKSLVNNFSL